MRTDDGLMKDASEASGPGLPAIIDLSKSVQNPNITMHERKEAEIYSTI